MVNPLESDGFIDQWHFVEVKGKISGLDRGCFLLFLLNKLQGHRNFRVGLLQFGQNGRYIPFLLAQTDQDHQLLGKVHNGNG